MSSYTHRQAVNEIIDTVLKEVKCFVCQKQFETAEQRDNALVLKFSGIDVSENESIRFIHKECKDELNIPST
jgi:hypothetical protein